MLGGLSVTNQDKRKILLLLSGGKDSHQVLKLLLEEGHAVHCLCIDGIQGLERVGAARAAQELGASLDVVKLSFFDEETWNPAKLLLRDLAMGYIAIKKGHRCEESRSRRSRSMVVAIFFKFWKMGLGSFGNRAPVSNLECSCV